MKNFKNKKWTLNPTSFVKGVLSFILISLFLSLQSCGNYYSIRTNLPPETLTKDTTVYSLWWGFTHPTIIPNCYGNGISEVTVKTNFGNKLISFVTLGIVVPIHIEYKCAKDN
ncbi:MAG TPA: hypothetical protein VNX01_07685 [Bacteroidia bacterium]|jgi:hypothetical protein|nr:hypothetical protein [Bacteroidia bacterium]